jgi:hypothetical protein
MRGDGRVPLLCAAAVALLVAGAVGIWGFFEEDIYVVGAMLAAGAIYAAAVWLVLRGEARGGWGRGALVLILAVAAILRLGFLVTEPLSTDVYRYVWDGRVQANGINPYRYVPADPALTDLRDDDIYPNINRADYAPTIYPPMAQMIFFAATWMSDSVTAVKAAMVAFEVLTVAAILGLLARRGLPPTRVIIYAWHPLPLFEFAGSGHVDAAALAFLMLACLAAERRSPAVAGGLLAAGALVKYFPAIAAPALWQGRGWRLPAAGLATAALLYVPYLSVGTGVLGFLSGYIREEGLAAGGDAASNEPFPLHLLGSVMTLPTNAKTLYLVAAAVLIAGLALLLLWRHPPRRVALAGLLILYTVVLAAISPRLPWYFTWVVPFVCFRPSAALVWLTCASPLLYGIVWPASQFRLDAAVYVPFAIVLIVETLLRSHRPPSEEVTNGFGLGRRRAA